MKYLCLIYEDQSLWSDLQPGEAEKHIRDCLEAEQSIITSGHYIAAEALDVVETAVTVRVRNGRLSATDGPFAETREQLGGFHLIEARDLADAIEVAARIPAARRGSVEIRPVVDFTHHP